MGHFSSSPMLSRARFTNQVTSVVNMYSLFIAFSEGSASGILNKVRSEDMSMESWGFRDSNLRNKVSQSESGGSFRKLHKRFLKYLKLLTWFVSRVSVGSNLSIFYANELGFSFNSGKTALATCVIKSSSFGTHRITMFIFSILGISAAGSLISNIFHIFPIVCESLTFSLFSQSRTMY